MQGDSSDSTAGSVFRSTGWAFRIAAGLVIVLCALRLAAPWRFVVINDEMHHLESWRNRYRTDNIYPMFMDRLEKTHRLSPKRLELVWKVYRSSPIIQRGIIVLVDPQPPIFPVMAECIEAVTHSSLIALRLPSMLSSLAAIGFAYLLGARVKDRSTGLWMAGLLAMGALGQAYAGIGRPYAMAQAAVVAFLYFFVREQQENNPTPRRLWLAALVAQAVQWMAWAIVGPLVVWELVRRYRAGARLPTLIKQTWWYALLSLILLCEMAVQLANPTISRQAGNVGVSMIWGQLCIASPFDHLASFGDGGFQLGGLIFLYLILLGVMVILFEGSGLLRTSPWPLGIAMASTLLAMLVIGSAMRFMMTYILVPLLLASLGARWVCRREAISNSVLAVVTAIFVLLTLFHPDDPFNQILAGDTYYDQVAQRIKAELKPGGGWMAVPYFLANDVYRYGPFPEPCQPQVLADIQPCLDNRSTQAPTLVLIYDTDIRHLGQVPVLRRWNYRNGVVLLEIPPRT
jgi:hypothetical protein